MADRLGGLEWLAEVADLRCTERSFRLRRSSGAVPGVLWSPGDKVPRATVLLFHGGSGHKRSERHLRMGRSLATVGLAVIAIDGPYHGDRVSAPMSPRVYQQLIVDEGIETFTRRMTADWLDAVSALAREGLADGARVSVFGLSMGARFGLPAAAALGPRLQCAVFGKFGIRQREPLHPGSSPPTSSSRPRAPSPRPCSAMSSGMTRSFPGTASSSCSTRWSPRISNSSPGKAHTARRTPTTRRRGRASSR